MRADRQTNRQTYTLITIIQSSDDAALYLVVLLAKANALLAAASGSMAVGSLFDSA